LNRGRIHQPSREIPAAFPHHADSQANRHDRRDGRPKGAGRLFLNNFIELLDTLTIIISLARILIIFVVMLSALTGRRHPTPSESFNP